MSRNTLHFMGRAALVSLLAGGILSTPLSLQANVSQQPLSLTEGVAPNILVTLDDSGSMARAYAPDGLSSSGRKARSPAYNPLYYNPDVTYAIPKKVRMVSGEVIVEDYPTPSFTNAYNDGFAQSGTRVNLSNSFRAGWGNTTVGFLTNCPSGGSMIS